MNYFSTQTTCPICNSIVNLTAGMMTETSTELHKAEDLTDEGVKVRLTDFNCPHCGKTCTVSMDDSVTMPLYSCYIALVNRIMKYQAAGRKIPEKMLKKAYDLAEKIDFKRQKLAEKYNGSFYQTEEGKEQLDCRYHVR